MKKKMIWFQAVLLVLSLTACGNSTESAEKNGIETTDTQPAADERKSFGREESASVNDDSENETGTSQDTASQDNGEASAVYFTSDISPEGLMAVYEA
jgi:hypothetical protein